MLINYLTNGEADIRDNPEWFDHSKWVFEEHERGAHRIVVPAIVIAELAGSGKIRENHISKDERYRRIKRVREWINTSDFQVVEITQSLAEDAAELAIEHQLTGADACIIAASTGMAAILSGSRVVHTKPVGRCGGPQGMISSGVT